MKDIVIIGANYGNGGSVKGAEKGSILLKNILNNTIELEDGGNLPDYSESTNTKLDCIAEFKIITQILHNKVFLYLKAGKKILNIGGDHSIALGTIWGASDFAKKEGLNFGVIYIDAHGDINTCERSLTKNIHGMPLAYATGIETLGFDGTLSLILNPSHLLYLGCRNLDAFERDYIKQNNISVITSQELMDTKWEEVIEKIYNFINNNDLQLIHLSVDIDVLDPHFAPGTGVPEKNGISPDYLINLIKEIMSFHKTRTVDFVEYNPLLDKENQTLKASERICSMILTNFK